MRRSARSSRFSRSRNSPATRPVTVAIRTAPVVADGRVVGATWVMTRLVDPLFVDRSLQGYRLAAGLALWRHRAGFCAHRGPGTHRPPPGGRARPPADRPEAQRTARGPGQAACRASPTRSATPWPASARPPSSGSAVSSGSTKNHWAVWFTRSIASKRSSLASSSSPAPTARTWLPAM